MYTVNRLNGWEPDQVGGVEVAVSDYRFLDSVNDDIRGHIQEQTDRYGGNLLFPHFRGTLSSDLCMARLAGY